MRRLPHAAMNFMSLHRRRLPTAGLVALAGLLVLVADGGVALAQRGSAPQSKPRPANRQAPQTKEAAPSVPKNFVPPRPIPDVMTLNKELVTEEEEKELQSSLRKYQKALRDGELNAVSRDLIERGVKYRLHRMTRKAHRQMLPIMRHELLAQDMAFASKGAGAPIAGREFFLEQVTKVSEELLDNNFHVRLNVVMILGNLILVEEDSRNGVKEKAYTPAIEILLKVFDDKTQLEAIKVSAVQGMERICMVGDPSRDQRLRVAEILVEELADPMANAWYQMRLAQALGNVGIIHDRQPRPFVVQSLATVLVDQKRDWQVRAQAAKALGRAPLDGSINVGLISYAIVDLAQQGAAAYNQSMANEAAAEASVPYWKDFFVTLYLAFQPIDAAERQAGRGLILRNRTGAYEQLLPVVRHVIHQDKQPIEKELLDALADWIAKNPPNSFSVAPGEPPIIAPQKVAGNK
ncbi:MAG: hypothetical protein WEB58_04230 [Planctomycetaceae bacterium]